MIYSSRRIKHSVLVANMAVSLVLALPSKASAQDHQTGPRGNTFGGATTAADDDRAVIAARQANPNQPIDETQGTVPSDDQVWRCSLDGKFYTITESNGVHIRAVNSGQMMAEVPLQLDKKGTVKTDRKGNDKLEGQWGSNSYGGLLVIQAMSAERIRGFVLAPTAGMPRSFCTSRKMAAVMSLGQPGPVCAVLSVSWDLQSGISSVEAAAAETQQVPQFAFSRRRKHPTTIIRINTSSARGRKKPSMAITVSRPHWSYGAMELTRKR